MNAFAFIMFVISGQTTFAEYQLPLVKEWMVKEELVDKRECRWFFSFENQTAEELAGKVLLRINTYSNHPHLCELDFYPSIGYTNQCISFNRQCLQHYQLMFAFYPHRTEYEALIKDCEKIYLIYDSLRNAQYEYYICGRRDALKTFKELLGEVELPVCIPTIKD